MKFCFSLMLVAPVFIGCNRNADVASIDVHTNDRAAEPAPPVAGTGTSGLYSVGEYDPERDANADLLATVEQAKAENKRIILEIGGHW